MDKEKQIEEMGNDMYALLPDDDANWRDCRNAARGMYDAGYRKILGWISVEDATPTNEHERVLVLLEDADFTRPIGNPKVDTDRFVDGKWVRWYKYVTHWMPLPEAQKMEVDSK